MFTDTAYLRFVFSGGKMANENVDKESTPMFESKFHLRKFEGNIKEFY